MIREHELEQRIRQLPKQLDPPKDLWPQLQAKLERASASQQKNKGSLDCKTQASQGWKIAIAASFLIGCGIWWSLQVSTTLSEMPANELAEHVVPSLPSHWQLQIEFEHQKAQRLAQMQHIPVVYQDWKFQLEIWQQATTQLLTLLDQEPDQPALLHQLKQIQQQQVYFLDKILVTDLRLLGV